MNRKAKWFQIANFTNLISFVTFLAIVLYRINHKSRFSSGDVIGYSILSFVLFVYLVNFYFGLKIVSVFYKETIDFKFKSTGRIVFIVFEIIVLIAYTCLLAFLIPGMTFEQFHAFTFDNLLRIMGMLSLFLGYLSSLLRLLLTRPVIRSITLKNKHIFDDLGAEAR